MDLSQIPSVAPPPGVSSNFLHPVSQAKEIKIVTTICMALMFLSFVMRSYARFWIKRTFKIDDGESFLVRWDSDRLKSHSHMCIGRGR